MILRIGLPVIRSPDHASTQLAHCCSPTSRSLAQVKCRPGPSADFVLRYSCPLPLGGGGWPAIPMHFIGTRDG